MRDTVRKALGDKKLPLVVAHRGGSAHGRENSVEAIKAVLPYKPDVIEVDVHKSKDGVLYCHHGSIPFGVSAATLHRFLPFKQIQLFIGKRDTLADILKAIPETVSVFLELKDGHITAGDLAPLITERKNVWIAAWKVAHVRALRKGLGDEYSYMLMRPIMRVTRALPEIKGVVDMVNVFVWQWNETTRKELERAGIATAYINWFLPKAYKTVPIRLREGAVFSAYDDLSETHRAE